MQKVVVILTQPIESNTSSMIRCKNIVKAIAQNGHQLTCFCPYPNVKKNNIEESDGDRVGLDVRRFGGEKNIKEYIANENVSRGFKQKVIMLAYKLFKKFDVFGASLQYLRYRKQICSEIQKEKFDIMITFSDPMTSHMIGVYCKRFLNIKYVQQWGDPLTTDIISKTALPKNVRFLIENALLKPADRVCYVSPFTCEEQQQLFKKYAHKMIFLPTPCIEYKKMSKEKEKRIRIGYFGSYNLVARDIRPFYQAACAIPECDFLIIGDSDLHLEPRDNIQIIERLSPSELDSYEQKTDVLVCLMNSKGNQIPGKVYHYAGSYKEILFIKDGEFGDKIEEFFAKYERYSFVENRASEIETVIKQYIAKGIPERRPLADFAAVNIAKELLKDI